ncbi:MAG: hydroxyacylglutathione hydrolase [Burkholderiales bacterium]|nr:hydroxyacylglutathione hydrolase [Burkholderiales bacterium]
MKIVPLAAFQDNYIWLLRKGEHAVVVDPGDADPVLSYLAHAKLRLVAIVNTHHHRDHVGGNARLLDSFRVPVYGPREEAIATLTHRLQEGDAIDFPELALQLTVLSIPGHTAGHIAYVGPGIVFCGDTLFAGGCGRLFEGSPEQMLGSLNKLAQLPAATQVYCGHEYTLANLRFALIVDPDNIELIAREESARASRAQDRPTLPSNIALEIATNPFLRCTDSRVISSVNDFAGQELTGPIEVFAALRQWKDQYKAA